MLRRERENYMTKETNNAAMKDTTSLPKKKTGRITGASSLLTPEKT
jgi:hypothetical protein